MVMVEGAVTSRLVAQILPNENIDQTQSTNVSIKFELFLSTRHCMASFIGRKFDCTMKCYLRSFCVVCIPVTAIDLGLFTHPDKAATMSEESIR